MTTPPPATEPAATPPPATEEGGKESRHRPFGEILRESVLEGNTVTVTVLALFTATVLGGLLVAFTNTTVLHAWGNFFSAPGARDREGLGRRDRHLRGAVRRVRVQPAHGRGAVPAGLDIRRHPRRLPVRRVQPAVRDRGAGDAADPRRARRRAAVPGRHVQHRRAEPVHRRRHRVARGSATASACRSSCTWSSASSAGSPAGRRSAGWPARSRRAPGRTR